MSDTTTGQAVNELVLYVPATMLLPLQVGEEVLGTAAKVEISKENCTIVGDGGQASSCLEQRCAMHAALQPLPDCGSPSSTPTGRSYLVCRTPELHSGPGCAGCGKEH